MRVLVTGATGFIGGHLCEALLAGGHTVRTLVRDRTRAAALAASGAEIVGGDLRDSAALAAAVAGVEVVFHIAALFRQENVTRAEVFAVNAAGTGSLLAAAAAAGVRRLVYCSSTGVHGDIPGRPAREDDPFEEIPGDHYQHSKIAAERAVRRFQESRRIETVVFRTTGAYGPRDTRFLKLFRSIARRVFVMIGSGEVPFPMIHIHDLVDGVVRCGTEPAAAGNAYFLTGDETVSLNELARRVAAAVGAPPPRWHVPAAPVLAAALACELICKPLRIQPPLYRRRVNFFLLRRTFDNSRAKNDLGWAPAIALDRGLAETAGWYRVNGML